MCTSVRARAWLHVELFSYGFSRVGGAPKAAPLGPPAWLSIQQSRPSPCFSAHRRNCTHSRALVGRTPAEPLLRRQQPSPCWADNDRAPCDQLYTRIVAYSVANLQSLHGTTSTLHQYTPFPTLWCRELKERAALHPPTLPCTHSLSLHSCRAISPGPTRTAERSQRTGQSAGIVSPHPLIQPPTAPRPCDCKRRRGYHWGGEETERRERSCTIGNQWRAVGQVVGEGAVVEVPGPLAEQGQELPTKQRGAPTRYCSAMRQDGLAAGQSTMTHSIFRQLVTARL